MLGKNNLFNMLWFYDVKLLGRCGVDCGVAERRPNSISQVKGKVDLLISHVHVTFHLKVKLGMRVF